MMMRIAAVAAALIAAGAWAADEPKPKSPPRPRLFDKSKLLDKAKGKVRPGEPDQPKAPAPGRSAEFLVTTILRRLDRDGDGKIGRKEADDRLARGFDYIDADRDGFLGRDELTKMLQELGRRGEGPLAPRGPAVDPFEALDRDIDGRLTRDEIRGTPDESQFERLDTNRDGKLDRKEFAAARR